MCHVRGGELWDARGRGWESQMPGGVTRTVSAHTWCGTALWDPNHREGKQLLGRALRLQCMCVQIAQEHKTKVIHYVGKLTHSVSTKHTWGPTACTGSVFVGENEQLLKV